MSNWEEEGVRQAVSECRKRIKRSGDHWWRLYQGYTGDADYQDSDVGIEPRHAN